MGVIVRLEKETFRVLNMFNKVVTVNSQAISKKRANKYAAALDSENKTINVNDIVKVVEGVNRGQQGQVKYLYRHFAFIYSKTFPENGGYFVCNTKQLLLASNHKTMGAASTTNGQLGFMSPRVLASPMHPSSNSANGGSTGGETGSRSTRQGNLSTGNMGSGSNSVNSKGTSPRTPLVGGQQSHAQMKPGTRRNVTLIGKTVRITQGPYKGYVGIVKDATDTTARVELHTKCQTISVDLVRLTVVDNVRGGSGVNRTPGGSFFATPSHVPGSATPTASSGTGKVFLIMVEIRSYLKFKILARLFDLKC